jgi:hypothetical protein
MHVISTAISPNPLETRPEKQNVNDIKDMIKLSPDQIKKEYPSSLSSSSYEMMKHDIEFSFSNINDND